MSNNENNDSKTSKFSYQPSSEQRSFQPTQASAISSKPEPPKVTSAETSTK